MNAFISRESLPANPAWDQGDHYRPHPSKPISLSEMNRHAGAILFQLATTMRESLDLNTMLQTAVNEIRAIFQCDRCYVLWHCRRDAEDEDSSFPILAVTHEIQHTTLPKLSEACPLNQTIVLADKILKRQTLRINDLDTDHLEKPLAVLLDCWDIKSCLLIPFITRSGQQGALVCANTYPHAWDDAEVDLLGAIVSHLEIAIEQANLYAQAQASERAAQAQARQLQTALEHLKQTQGQLIQSEKLSSLGQLVAGIAHEINNPVNFISGNIKFAQGYVQNLLTLVSLYQTHYPTPVAPIQDYITEIDLEFLGEDLNEVLNSMEMGTGRIVEIVRSLRNFSRINDTKLEAMDIHDGINSTLLILEHRLKAKGQNPGVQIIKHYGALPLVECYGGLLNQVLMNLVSNAIDALEECPAPRQITIATETGTIALMGEAVPSVTIRIQDNGSGMTDEAQSHLFERFFTTKPVGKGTGLGLSISHQIVTQKHHGTLTCHSQLGVGTEFIVEIPQTQRSPGAYRLN